MNFAWLIPSLARWFFFNVVLALLQLWILIMFRWLRGDPVNFLNLLLDGVLIFYANSMAMGVMERRLDEMRLIVGRTGKIRVERDLASFIGVGVSLVVLVLCVTMYCAMLSTSNRMVERIILVEVLITILALVASVTHNIELWRRFEGPEERGLQGSLGGIRPAPGSEGLGA